MCVAHRGCTNRASDSGWGRGQQPVINVSWRDAKEFVAWLSNLTGQSYRLLSESEWEYVARAGSTTEYSFGDVNWGTLNLISEYASWGKTPVAVGQRKPNQFGLYDVHGNVWEWVEDCFHNSYIGAPIDGSPRIIGDCDGRVIRGGSWGESYSSLASATRNWYNIEGRTTNIGFRVARTFMDRH